jgi:hypothetical protein
MYSCIEYDAGGYSVTLVVGFRSEVHAKAWITQNSDLPLVYNGLTSAEDFDLLKKMHVKTCDYRNY